MKRWITPAVKVLCYIKHLLGKEELNDKCGLYAEVTIPVGSALGYHEHVGNSETYYVLKGHALYNDNGSIREIGPGEVTFTPNGFKHGVDNTKGTEDFVFMALIINDWSGTTKQPSTH